MNQNLINTFITTGVPSAVSLIGFFITTHSLKKNFRNELEKNRDTVALEKMSTIPYEVLSLFDNMMDAESLNNKQQKMKQEDNLKNFKKLMNTIYSYGSIDAIKIASLMQKENYEAAKLKGNRDNYRMMSVLILLATQIKYDVTSVAVSPKYWFEMKLNDFSANQRKFAEANNKLIDELNLNNSFKI
ncbi:hypothetical protein ACVR1I_03615 [Streptococcus cameli]